MQSSWKNSIFALLIMCLVIFQISCQKAEDDPELEHGGGTEEQGKCTKPTSAQIDIVNLGYLKLDFFLNQCRLETGNSHWCNEVARPNPDSHETFTCTYGNTQPRFFIHPEEQTWNYAIEAVKIVQELEANNIDVCTIYNWWRPEPYNKNVGGAAGRHPFGTSVDVRFCTKFDQEKAHQELCKMRKNGRIRAVGYYSSTSLHIGVGDKLANTWGKNCP